MTIENDGAIALGTASPETGAPTVNPGETVTPATTGIDTPAPGSEPAEPPKRKSDGGFQRRIDELTRKNHELRRELDRSRTDRPTPDKVTQPMAGPPKFQDFNTYEEYLDARQDWKDQEREKQRTQKQTQQQERQQMGELLNTFDERAEKLREKYEDFDDVCFGDHVVITEAMGMVIMDSELGPEINYYLGRNPKEALRIAKLGPYAAAREIGKLELKLEQQPPTKKQPSNAPEPITPVKPKAPVSDDPSDNDDINTWMTKRRQKTRG